MQTEVWDYHRETTRNSRQVISRWQLNITEHMASHQLHTEVHCFFLVAIIPHAFVCILLLSMINNNANSIMMSTTVTTHVVLQTDSITVPVTYNVTCCQVECDDVCYVVEMTTL